MYPWLKTASLSPAQRSAVASATGYDDRNDLFVAKVASDIPDSARNIVKRAYNELAQMSMAQLPYMMGDSVSQEQQQRGLGLPGVALLGAGLTGLHLAGDADTMGNKVKGTINRTLGTDLDTQSRAEAVLKALR